MYSFKNFLILRLGQDKSSDALKQPYARQFDITGKPMKGWVMIADDGYKSDPDLKGWLIQAKNFAESLPAK
jgi:hypothetical protein